MLKELMMTKNFRYVAVAMKKTDKLYNHTLGKLYFTAMSYYDNINSIIWVLISTTTVVKENSAKGHIQQTYCQTEAHVGYTCIHINLT